MTPFVDGYAAGLTPNPCNALQRRLPLRTSSSPSRSAPARTRSGPVTTPVSSSGDGMRLVARAADPAKDQSYMLATVDPGAARPRRVPTRATDEGRDARGGGRRPGSPRRDRRESQEACFLGGRRLPRVPRGVPASRTSRERSSTRRRRASGGTTASGGSRRASVAGSASRGPSRCTRSARSRARQHARSSARERSLACRELTRAAGCTSRRSASRRRCGYRAAAVPAHPSRTRRTASVSARRARRGRRPRAGRGALRRRRRRRSRRDRARDGVGSRA